MTEGEEQAAIAAAKRDPRRFTPLYECYFGDIFRFLLRRAGDRDLTNDLAQETFLKAMLALPRYQERGLPFRAWLYRIALNELRMHWRKRKEVLNLAHLPCSEGMKQHYRITPNGRGPEPTDAELLRYKDSGKLLFNYQRAATLLHRKPLYKDPKAFMVLVLIVLLAWFISEVVDKEDRGKGGAPAVPKRGTDVFVRRSCKGARGNPFAFFSCEWLLANQLQRVRHGPVHGWCHDHVVAICQCR
ncbi:MAG: RNA polymerase sigma factor [Flavobacteriales bacterium]|nr:RNA polymerase sigma factor [Flavobacteriales bacterium]